jgi:hypothetical protein
MSLNAVSEDIRSLLNTNLFGVSGVDLFSLEWGTTADGEEIDKQIAITDSDEIDATNKTAYAQPTFIIWVRGNINESHKSVHDRARDIYEFMLQQERQTLNGNLYIQYAPQGGLLSLGKDDNKRIVYSMNFYTYREPL